MHSRLWLAAAAFLVWACAPATSSRARGNRVSTSGLIPIERATWLAKAAFDSAATAGDTGRIAAFFAEDALLISATEDSIRGREAIAHYLIQLAPAAISADFTFGRDAFELCQGGGRERLTFVAHVTHAGESPDTVSGHLAVFWKRDAAGNLTVAKASFSKLDAGRRSSRFDCPSLDDSIWRSWRFAITMFPVAVYGTSAEHDFEKVLRSRGWVGDCLCGGIPSFTPVSKSNGRLLPGLLGLQYHWRRHAIGEIVIGRLPSGSTMGAQTYGNRDYAQTRLFYSGAYFGALLSYERWGIQVGIGPAVQVAHWRLRDSVIPYSTGGYPSFRDQKWSTLPFGIIGDARFHRLISSRLFFAMRGEARRFRRASTPPTMRFPEATVAQNSFFFGVGWGVVF